MRRDRRHAKIDRGDEDAAFGKRLRHKVVVGAVLAGPGAAMHLQRRREWPRPAWPVQPCQHPLLVLDILDREGVVGGDRIRHGFLPKLMGQSRVSASRLPQSPPPQDLSGGRYFGSALRQTRREERRKSNMPIT